MLSLKPAHAHRSGHDDEDRPGIAALRERAPEVLWGHGARGVVSHRGTGAPGPRRDPLRQRRLGHAGTAGRRLRALAAPGRAVRRPARPPYAPRGAGFPAGRPVRYHPFPHRLPAFSSLAAPAATEPDDAARTPEHPRPRAPLSRVPRDAR